MGIKFTQKFYDDSHGIYYREWEKELIDAGGEHYVVYEGDEIVLLGSYRPEKKYSRGCWTELKNTENGLKAEVHGKKMFSPEEVEGMMNIMNAWIVSMASHGYLEYENETAVVE